MSQLTVNIVLFAIFACLIGWIGKNKGTLALFALFFNLIFLFIMLILINWGFSSIILTLITSVTITAMNLFFINGYHPQTITAFFSSLIVLVIMMLLIFFSVRIMHLQGIPTEELMEMDMYSLNIGISFVSLSTSVLVMSVASAINDISISITSSVYELKRSTPTLSTTELITSGMTIGKDVLGSTMNTLIFALVGGQLALFVWVSDLNYSFQQFFNTKILVLEWSNLLLSGIAISLTIPISTILITQSVKHMESSKK